jgi:hypothetical protein
MHLQNRVEVGWHTNLHNSDHHLPLLPSSTMALSSRLLRKRAQRSHPLHHHHRHHFHYRSPSLSCLVTGILGPSISSPFLIRVIHRLVHGKSFTIQSGLRFGSQVFRYASSPLSSPFSSLTSLLMHHALYHILHFFIQYRFLSY